MTMAACYANYEMSSLSHAHNMSAAAVVALQQQQHSQAQAQAHFLQQQTPQTQPYMNYSQPVANAVVSSRHSNAASGAHSHTHSHHTHSRQSAAAAARTSSSNSAGVGSSNAVTVAVAGSGSASPQKDYSIPLHVDCSVEYELPNQPKPPAGQRVEPLLMIHPCYFRKMESQRRSPFVNNMQATARSAANSAVSTAAALGGATALAQVAVPSSTARRGSRQTQAQVQQQQQYQQQQQQLRQQHSHSHSHSQQQLSQMSQQAHYPVQQPQPQPAHQQQQQSSLEHVGVVRRQLQQQQPHQRNSSSSNQSRLSQSNSSSTNNNSSNSASLAVSAVSSLQTTQWDHLAAAIAARTAMTPVAAHAHLLAGPHPGAQSLRGGSVTGAGVGATSGKRDAMISGSGYHGSSSANNSAKHHHQHHQQQQQQPPQQHCLPPVAWDPTVSASSVGLGSAAPTNTIVAAAAAAAMLIDRSPMATVPSNYQAGPDTSASAATAATDKLSGKYRQYLRSQRMHPYLATNLAGNLGQSSFAPFTAATAASAAIAATPTFQHLQQISCYNV